MQMSVSKLASVVLLSGLMASSIGCNRVADSLSLGHVSKDNSSQTKTILDDVEVRVSRLIADAVAELEAAASTNNPLKSKAFDPDKFNQELATQLDRLMDQTLTLKTVIAGFRQTDEGILVAFVDQRWNPKNMERLPPYSALRFRLNSEECDALRSETIMQSLGKNASPEEQMAAALSMLMQTPTLTKGYSRISIAGVAGKNLETEKIRSLDIGSSFDCRVKITSWKLIETVNNAPGFLGMIGTGDAEIDEHFRLARSPYIELICEWVSSE